MIAKVNDASITNDCIKLMTKKEIKNLENRLRSKAKNINYIVCKYNHPSYGDKYILADLGRGQNKSMSLFELKQSIYDKLKGE